MEQCIIHFNTGPTLITLKFFVGRDPPLDHAISSLPLSLGRGASFKRPSPRIILLQVHPVCVHTDSVQLRGCRVSGGGAYIHTFELDGCHRRSPTTAEAWTKPMITHYSRMVNSQSRRYTGCPCRLDRAWCFHGAAATNCGSSECKTSSGGVAASRQRCPTLRGAYLLSCASWRSPGGS